MNRRRHDELMMMMTCRQTPPVSARASRRSVSNDYANKDGKCSCRSLKLFGATRREAEVKDRRGDDDNDNDREEVGSATRPRLMSTQMSSDELIRRARTQLYRRCHPSDDPLQRFSIANERHSSSTAAMSTQTPRLKVKRRPPPTR